MTTPVTPAPAQAGFSTLVPIALSTVLLMGACAGRSTRRALLLTGEAKTIPEPLHQIVGAHGAGNKARLAADRGETVDLVSSCGGFRSAPSTVLSILAQRRSVRPVSTVTRKWLLLS